MVEPPNISPVTISPSILAPRQPQIIESRPTHVVGTCPKCTARVALSPLVHYSDDSLLECAACGTKAGRRRLIFEGLAVNDALTWGFLASDIGLQDSVEAGLIAPVTYDIPAPANVVAKWQHWEARAADLRYSVTLTFGNAAAFLFLTQITPGDPPSGNQTRVHVDWTRFGVSSLERIPAWRQSLYAAATLVQTYPSAALVLIAAGFEAFFNDMVRIKWNERGLDSAAYRRLADSNMGIASMLSWIPEAVGLPSFKSAPDDLNNRWGTLVNRPRNAVVHRGSIDSTSEDARAALRVTLEAIVHFDCDALSRPHVYYLA